TGAVLQGNGFSVNGYDRRRLGLEALYKLLLVVVVRADVGDVKHLGLCCSLGRSLATYTSACNRN
ncbi:hypothetical protein LCGC14_1566550, partial [marine sediment metagenome]